MAVNKTCGKKKKNLFQLIAPTSLKLFPKNEIWEKWVEEGGRRKKKESRGDRRGRRMRIKSHSGKWGCFRRTEAEEEEDEERKNKRRRRRAKRRRRVQYWKREERWRGKEETPKKSGESVRGRTAMANKGTEAEADKIWCPLLTLSRVWQSYYVVPTAWFHWTEMYFCVLL